MAKEVPFAAIPRRPTPEALDDFVRGTHQQQPEIPAASTAPPLPPPAPIIPIPPKVQVPMKRLTFDIPADLHMRMKLACVREGKDMAEVLRELIAGRFP
jgi:hypothetical protein